MEIKILQVFYGKDGLPYKDKDRQVHFPIAGTGFLGASNTTQIKFYYDELDNLDDTTWVAVSKLPNGKLGSRVLESHLDSDLNEHYALLELDNYYTQYKGDVFISLQGYQGGVDFDYDEENSQYEIHGTPTIAATGSIKFTINYANQFVGSGETDNINFQRILAALGTKLGMRAYSEHVEELPSEGSPDVFYVVNDEPNNPHLANIYVWNENTRHYIWVGDNTLDLGEYYTKESGNTFEQRTNEKIDNLSNEIQQVANGSPKGVYATLSDLESAYPTGTTGIFVVQADGHWYYWDGTQWADGGVYQATAISDSDPTIVAMKYDFTFISGLEHIDFLDNSFINLDFPTGTVIDYENPSSTSLAMCAVVECNPRDLFFIETLMGGSGSRAYGFLDEDGKLLNVAYARFTASHMVLTAPPEAKYLVLNNLKAFTNNPIAYKGKVNKLQTLADKLYTLVNEDLSPYTQYAVWYQGETVGNAIQIVSISNTKSLYIPVNEGEKYLITCKGGSNGRAFYLLNSDNEIVSMAQQSVTLSNYEITIPSGVSYLVVQTNALATWSVEKKSLYDIAKINEDVDNLNSVYSKDYTNLGVQQRWYVGSTIGGTVQVYTDESFSNTKSYVGNVNEGDKYLISCSSGSEGRAYILLNQDNEIVDVAAANAQLVDFELTIPQDVKFIIVQTNNLSNFSVKKYGSLEELQDDVNKIENVLYIPTRTSKTKFCNAALKKLLLKNSGVVNIGFIGDSWTQGTQDTAEFDWHWESYVEPLSQKLFDKYGFAGLGWLDFSRNGGTGRMFGCIDMYKHWTFSFTGTITGLDGSTSAQDAANCLGPCCAHTIFANGSTLHLTFNNGYIDKFKIAYYKDAHFTISINNGQAIEITANSTDGWQETELGSTGTDTTDILITSLADGTIIFGIDCFYGTKGVRCHKIGNRGITVAKLIAMNEDQYETALKSFDLCWVSTLFAINDIGSSTSDIVIQNIINSYESLIDRLEETFTTNGLMTCDISILGIANISSASYGDLPKLEEKEKEMAFEHEFGWCSTRECIGVNKAELVYTGLFSDTVHLNKVGTYIFGEYIYKCLFEDIV